MVRLLKDLGGFGTTKRNKYGNRRVVIQGIKFDSTREGYRWLFLKDCEKKGLISNLRRQVWFTLIPDEYETVPVQLKTKVRYDRKRVFVGVKYKADFVYEKDGMTVVEDVKGTTDSREMHKGAVDDTFFLKLKMMHYLLHIDIRLVSSPTEPV